MSRPEPNQPPSTERLTIHLTTEEMKILKDAAAKEGLKVAAFIREAALRAVEISKLTGE